MCVSYVSSWAWSATPRCLLWTAYGPLRPHPSDPGLAALPPPPRTSPLQYVALEPLRGRPRPRSRPAGFLLRAVGLAALPWTVLATPRSQAITGDPSLSPLPVSQSLLTTWDADGSEGWSHIPSKRPSRVRLPPSTASGRPEEEWRGRARTPVSERAPEARSVQGGAPAVSLPGPRRLTSRTRQLWELRSRWMMFME